MFFDALSWFWFALIVFFFARRCKLAVALYCHCTSQQWKLCQTCGLKGKVSGVEKCYSKSHSCYLKSHSHFYFKCGYLIVFSATKLPSKMFYRILPPASVTVWCMFPLEAKFFNLKPWKHHWPTVLSLCDPVCVPVILNRPSLCFS